jgi:ribosomal protein S18 acetylase RimI-like enzyme
MIKIISAISQKELDEIRKLFIEYSNSLEFNLDFQDFKNEIKNLPADYSLPNGKLYLAIFKDKAAGCIALRKIDNEYCEMKRLYVRPKFRGLKIGKALTEVIINEAGRLGYKFMRLDTFPSMDAARKLYKEFGFKEIPAYRYNPVKGAIYMELKLQKKENIKINIQDYLECSIKFNPWRHHKNYICKKIEDYSAQKDNSIKELKKNLVHAGNSQVDLYTGDLLICQITQNIAFELLKDNITNKNLYTNWLHRSGKDYRNVALQDNSLWTLRLSEEDEKFIHIHPSRHSLNTIRVRATTLQTAIAVSLISRIKAVSPTDVKIINEVRKQFFNQSQIKVVYKNSGLGKIISLLEWRD